MQSTHIFQHTNSLQATIGVFNDDAGRAKKLIVEFLTRRKFSVFGLFDGHFNGDTDWGMTQETQILFEY